MFIVIEGQDATGKDTQARMLADFLRAQGKNVIHYAESGTASEDPFTAEIARLNYGTIQPIDHRTRVLLYLINRYDQWRRLAEPALRNGDIVITTRSWLSTIIYEGYGGGVSRSLITKLHKLIMPEQYFHPDKSVIFTISEAEQTIRLASQGERKNEVWKSKGPNFQHTLNQAYLTVAKKYSVPTLEVTGTPEQIFEKLKDLFGL